MKIIPKVAAGGFFMNAEIYLMRKTGEQFKAIDEVLPSIAESLRVIKVNVVYKTRLNEIGRASCRERV